MSQTISVSSWHGAVVLNSSNVDANVFDPRRKSCFDHKTSGECKKLQAQRRRRSLFVPQRCETDYGNALLTHADFPKARIKSLCALNRERKLQYDKQLAHKMMEQVANIELSFKSYDIKECETASNKITNTLNKKLSSTFDLSGCKMICLCYIAKRAKPSLSIDSGCAWDEMKRTVEKDAFVDYVYKNQRIVAVISVLDISCRRFPSTKVGLDNLQTPSTSLPKARSAAMSEPAGRSHELSDGMFGVAPPRKDQWVG
ncbi:uncharacterized protein LOC111326788 [Stylophora pistillata]|nr:uncharacterized protein LOC111326788 [Stylophora pistillata]